MKKFLKHIFVFATAAYFMLMSLGFNLAHYCCAECKKQGIEYIALNACKKIAPDVQEQASTCCSESKEVENWDKMDLETECCTLSRFHTDTPVFQEKADFSQLFASFVFDAFTGDSLYDTNEISVNKTSFYHNKIPPNTGRDILKRHAVLLI